MIELDDMLDLQAAAQWLGLSTKALAAKSKGHRPLIPAFRLGPQSPRFHPRTIVAKLAADAGVAPEVIAASMRFKH